MTDKQTTSAISTFNSIEKKLYRRIDARLYGLDYVAEKYFDAAVVQYFDGNSKLSNVNLFNNYFKGDAEEAMKAGRYLQPLPKAIQDTSNIDIYLEEIRERYDGIMMLQSCLEALEEYLLEDMPSEALEELSLEDMPSEALEDMSLSRFTSALLERFWCDEALELIKLFINEAKQRQSKLTTI